MGPENFNYSFNKHFELILCSRIDVLLPEILEIL